MGFVPSIRSRPNVGTTHGDAFVVTIPIMSASAMRSAYKDAAPKWRPSRTATAPTPASCALATARSVARAAVTIPSAPCPSTSAVATDSRTTSNGALGLDVTVAQARYVTGVAHEVRDAVGVEAEEIGFDEELGCDAGVIGRDAERLEHGAREGAQRLRRDALLGHGRPACGTSTRMVRITPVAVPAHTFSSALSADKRNNVQPSSPPSAHA